MKIMSVRAEVEIDGKPALLEIPNAGCDSTIEIEYTTEYNDYDMGFVQYYETKIGQTKITLTLIPAPSEDDGTQFRVLMADPKKDDLF